MTDIGAKRAASEELIVDRNVRQRQTRSASPRIPEYPPVRLLRISSDPQLYPYRPRMRAQRRSFSAPADLPEDPPIPTSPDQQELEQQEPNQARSVGPATVRPSQPHSPDDVDATLLSPILQVPEYTDSQVSDETVENPTVSESLSEQRLEEIKQTVMDLLQEERNTYVDLSHLLITQAIRETTQQEHFHHRDEVTARLENVQQEIATMRQQGDADSLRHMVAEMRSFCRTQAVMDSVYQNWVRAHAEELGAASEETQVAYEDNITMLREIVADINRDLERTLADTAEICRRYQLLETTLTQEVEEEEEEE